MKRSMANKAKRIFFGLVILISPIFISVANANLSELPDFDWPQYWPEPENDTTVACAHVAVANALYYWDSTFPDLIPDSYGDPEKMDFQAEDGKTYKLTSFWNLMSELTKDDYLGSGTVSTSKIGKGIEAWFKKQGVGLSYHSTAGMEFTEKWDFTKRMFDKGEVPIILLEVEGGENHWVTGCGYDDDNSLSIYGPNKIGKSTQQYDLTRKDDGWYIKYDGHDARIWSVQAVTAIPEPAALMLASIGVGFVTWLRRRRAL